jgi:predicted dehydrogenase
MDQKAPSGLISKISIGWSSFDANDSVELQGSHGLLVTGPGHPYADHFWPPGHIIGYEHTFILTLADFLQSLADNQRFRPDFNDAIEVQQVLQAVQESASGRTWVSMPRSTSSLENS